VSTGPLAPPVQSGWRAVGLYQANGRTLTPGVECTIAGERGRFRFVRAVTSPSGHVWLDFMGGTTGVTMWRSFRPDRVRTVHRIAKTRENAKES